MPTRNLGRGIRSSRCSTTLSRRVSTSRSSWPSPSPPFIDLTPGEGCLARAAYQLGLRYTGLTFNEAHAAGLRGRLEGCVISDMIQEGHRFYDATFHAAVRRRRRRQRQAQQPRERPQPAPQEEAAQLE